MRVVLVPMCGRFRLTGHGIGVSRSGFVRLYNFLGIEERRIMNREVMNMRAKVDMMSFPLQIALFELQHFYGHLTYQNITSPSDIPRKKKCVISIPVHFAQQLNHSSVLYSLN